MRFKVNFLMIPLLAAALVQPLAAQVHTPWVTLRGEPDTRDLGRLVTTLYENAAAVTDRQKAETLWSYLLTDGRFVEPGMFYHIAGWAYEEPLGEVLDPLKLLNSYGFGLCYQDGPLLEALFEAGGFADARSWFLTGHTVCEVFFDKRYSMLDCDMLGYTTVGDGDPRSSPIAGVRELEADGDIIMGKLLAPNKADSMKVVYPWYPADVRARAMESYAGLFTSTGDNWLFPFRRYPRGHSMDFVLRPGEKLVRYYAPESQSLYYLPYKQAGGVWEEFPNELERWNIRTEDGPRSQKDERRWATGRLVYTPPLHRRSAFYPVEAEGFNQNLSLPSAAEGAVVRSDETLPSSAVFAMASPYVLIDAGFELYAELASAHHQLIVETSTDLGKSWQSAGQVRGPHAGPWRAAVQALTVGDHGARNALSGKYGYLVRITLAGPGGRAAFGNLRLTSLFQLNPRSLPQLVSGENELIYSPGSQRVRTSIPVDLSRLSEFALSVDDLVYTEEHGNRILSPAGWKKGEAVFELTAPGGGDVASLEAGGRFLALRELAPEKTTAETRITVQKGSPPGADASLEWAVSADGPWQKLWDYEPPSRWLDGNRESRLLCWPEVDERVKLPQGTETVYVRYKLNGMALDDIRLAVSSPVAQTGGPLVITHRWQSRNAQRSHSVRLEDPSEQTTYIVNTGPGEVRNLAVEFECPLE
ncbi:MAG: hypothetical protein FVQ81_03555 [Candidatus Glassbacteria bacterium]|nr:hypothetical protein [Candidatus Glassbacteria bacterium]